jgi:hypothetical protein
MRAFTADELARMRATAQSSMFDSCAVTRLTQASDGAGGQTETWATVATVACRVTPQVIRGRDLDIAERIAMSQQFIITVPAGTNVLVSDRIVSGGVTYEVVSAGAPHTLETGRQVTVNKVL